MPNLGLPEKNGLIKPSKSLGLKGNWLIWFKLSPPLLVDFEISSSDGMIWIAETSQLIAKDKAVRSSGFILYLRFLAVDVLVTIYRNVTICEYKAT